MPPTLSWEMRGEGASINETEQNRLSYLLLLLLRLSSCLSSFHSGMSGNTAKDIQKVDPKFIKKAKIEQSLTPGRNNGFLNMLRVMKQKALQLDEAARANNGGSEAAVNGKAGASEEVEEAPAVVPNDDSHGPKYNEIIQALQVLKPTSLTLIDNSHQHAGHAGNDMDGESHFELEIVADAFDGLSLVKRHQLIYMVLGNVMPRIHALQIKSLTPTEAEKQASM